jgi:hypothetical protein
MAYPPGLPAEQRALYDAIQKMQGGTSLGQRQREKAASETAQKIADEMDELEGNFKDLNKSIEKMLVETKDSNDALKKANNALFKSAKSIITLGDEFDSINRKSIPEMRDHLKKHSKVTEDLTTQLGKTLRNQSLFSASLLASHTEVTHGTVEYSSMMKKMNEAAGKLSKSVLMNANAWDETTGTLRTNLSPQEFAHLRVVLGQTETALTESIGGVEAIGHLSKLAAMNLEDFTKTISANEEPGKKLQAQIISAVASLESMGHAIKIPGAGGKTEEVSVTSIGEHGQRVLDKTKIDALQANTDKLQSVIKSLLAESKANESAIKDFHEIGTRSSTVFGSWVNNIGKAIEDITGLNGAAKFAKMGLLALGDTAAIGWGLNKLREGVTEFYTDMVKFNVAQVPASLGFVKTEAYGLGMSFEDTVKFMQENKRGMAVLGKSWSSFTTNLKGTFQQFGYNMQQGSSMVGPAIDAAIASGVNVRDQKALQDSVKQSMKAFHDVAGIVNMTGEEYMKMRAQLLQSSEVQANLLGLSRKETQTRVNEITEMQKHYLAEGIAADTVNELIRAQQAQIKEPIKEQIANAAKLAMGAQAAGLSGAQSARLQQLYLLGGAGRAAMGAGTEKEFESLNKQAQKGLAQRMAGAAATGNVGQILGEENLQQYINSLSGSAAAQADAAKQADVLAKAHANLTNKEVEEQAKLAQGTEAVAKFSNVINTISSFLHDSLGKVLLGTSAALLGLAVQSGITAASLGRLGGGGILSKVAGLFKRGGGAAAGEAAAAEGAGGAGAMGALGTAGLWAGGIAAAGAAGYGLGTLINKAPKLFGGQELSTDIAGWLSPKYNPNAHPFNVNAYRKAHHIVMGHPVTGPVSGAGHPPPGVNTGTPTSSGQLTVHDEDAHDYLKQIADSMVKAVQLLQTMSDGGNKVPAQVIAERLRTAGNKNIPSATSYTTGRAPA